MSPDLKDLFDDAGRTPPAGRGYDADDVVSRGARIRTRRRALTGAATLAVAAVVVGGSIALIGPGLGTSATIEPGGSAEPSPSTSTTPDPRPTTSTSIAARDCTSDDVTLTLSSGGAGAGTNYDVIMIKAKPTITCRVSGFVDLRADRAVGDPIGPAAPSGEAAGSVPLNGSSVASFLVGMTNTDNYDAEVCLPVLSRSLSVTLPHNTAPIAVPLTNAVTVCSGNVSAFGNQLTVTPIVAGPDGQ
jgi:hypothetical protein